MATGAIEEEAHDLLEGFLNGQALGILSDGGKKSGEVRIDADSTEVAGKQVESGSAGQTIGCDLDILDEICTLGFALGHPVLHPLGDEFIGFDWIYL